MTVGAASEKALERVRKSLRCLLHGLLPFVEGQLRTRYGADWQSHVSHAGTGAAPIGLDEYAVLKTLLDNWQTVFADCFTTPAQRHRARGFVSTALEARNVVSHAAADIEDAAALRYLDACHELLCLVGAPAPEIAEAKRLYDAQRRGGPPSQAATAVVDGLFHGARSGRGTMATIAERLLDCVRRQPDLDDDELARNLGIQPRQTINQAARRLERQGLLRRFVGPRGKIVNRAQDARR